MIRRDIVARDGSKQWLLISQVEHARLSGILAELALSQFGTLAGCAEQPLEGVRQELLAAIVHHDDGWADWESRLPLDDEHRRPPSFLELPWPDSLAIWSDSIRAAQSIGNLAAWVVAGHFIALLKASDDHRDTPEGKAWLSDTLECCHGWFAAWQAEDKLLHTQPLADEALLWLQLYDVLSLWLCMSCPGGGEHVISWPEQYICCKDKPLQTVIGPSVGTTDPNYPANTDRCRASINPWRFEVTEIALDAEGKILPAKEYQSSVEVFNAWAPHHMRWLLIPTSA